MIRALVLGLLAFAVVACDKQQVDTGINLTFAVACGGVGPAYEAWYGYLKNHKVSVADQQKVTAAYNAALQNCESPPANTAEAIQAVILGAIQFKMLVDKYRNA